MHEDNRPPAVRQYLFLPKPCAIVIESDQPIDASYGCQILQVVQHLIADGDRQRLRITVKIDRAN